MTRLLRSLLVAGLVIPSVLWAQGVEVVRPDPDAETELHRMAYKSDSYFQTFVAPKFAVHLTTFSFWWTGTEYLEQDWYAGGYLGLDCGPDGSSCGGTTGPFSLDNDSYGWQTLSFNVPVSPGERLSFYLWGTNGYSYYSDIATPDLLMSAGDAYADGEFWGLNSTVAPSTDLMFKSEFVVAPEPGTIGLLALGLLALGVAARNKQRPARVAS